MTTLARRQESIPIVSGLKWGIACLTGREANFFIEDPEGYERAVNYFQKREEIGKAIRRVIEEHFDGKSQPHSALDTACGTGIITEYIEGSVHQEGRVIGRDVSKPSVEYAAKTKSPRIEWQEGSFENLEGIEDGSIDIYTMVAAHRFIEDLRAFYGEMARVLNEDGLAILPWFSPDIKRSTLRKVRNVIPELGLEMDIHRMRLRGFFNRLFVRRFLLFKKT